MLMALLKVDRAASMQTKPLGQIGVGDFLDLTPREGAPAPFPRKRLLMQEGAPLQQADSGIGLDLHARQGEEI